MPSPKIFVLALPVLAFCDMPLSTTRTVADLVSEGVPQSVKPVESMVVQSGNPNHMMTVPGPQSASNVKKGLGMPKLAPATVQRSAPLDGAAQGLTQAEDWRAMFPVKQR